MKNEKKINSIPAVAVRRTREFQPCIKKWLRYPIKTLGYGNKYAQAFTLIELLVVVLIIGILAAIAVPQYRLAVEKARVTQNILSVEHVVKELSVYYLANNQWPAQLSDLGVDIPASCSGYAKGSRYYIYCGKRYRIQLDNGKIVRRYCYADKNNDFENKLCQVLTGTKTIFANGAEVNGYKYQ